MSDTAPELEGASLLPETSSPSAESVVSLLDSEIERIAGEKERDGRSLFAILGALAALFWALVDVWEDGNFQLRDSYYWLVVCVGVRVAIHHFSSSEQGESWRPVGQRFAAARHIGAVRGHISESILYEAFFLVLVFSVAANIPMWGVLAALVRGLSVIVSAILVFRAPQLNVVIPFDSPTIQRIFPISKIMHSLVLGVILLAIGTLVDFPEPGTKLAPIKAAVLVVALVELMRALTANRRSPIHLSSLSSIRRDLVFRRISVDEAIKNAEAELTGDTLQDVIEPIRKDLQAAIDQSHVDLRAVEAKLLKASAGLLLIQSNDSTASDADSCVGEFKAVARELQSVAEASSAAFTRAQKRTRWLALASPDTQKEARAYILGAEQAFVDVQSKIRDLTEHIKLGIDTARSSVTL
jgi:hypothetical protein